MAQPTPYGYFYGNEAEQFTFYRIPKALFTNPRFKSISGDAKILYGLMLDRMGLSIKNRWLDDKDRVFIYFTLEDVQEYIGCQRDKGMKLLAELDTDKGVGLIERVKQGLGKPTIIYVRQFIDATDFQRSEKPTSGLHDLPTSGLPEKPTYAHRKNRPPEVGESDSNDTKYINNDFNNTDFNNTYPIQSYQQQETPAAPKARTGLDDDGMAERNSYRDFIKDNIEYDILVQSNDRERMDEAVELMLDAVCSKRQYITIAGDDFPKEVVKSRLLKLNSSHIEYVFDCIDKNTTKVRNIKKYLLAALYLMNVLRNWTLIMLRLLSI